MHMARQSTGTAVPVLLTRAKAQSHAFAEALGERFGDRLRPVVAPLMAPEYLHPALPKGPFAGVIFTSAHGVEAAVGLGVALPGLAWCVGGQTAIRARAAGFQPQVAGGDAAALVAAIMADPPQGRLLHLRGEDARGEVAERLISAGIETVSVVVYRQAPQPLTPEALALLQGDGPVIVPVFSPRSASLLCAALPDGLRADLSLVAMSEAVAQALDAVPRLALTVARRPDADAMLDAVARGLESLPAP